MSYVNGPAAWGNGWQTVKKEKEVKTIEELRLGLLSIWHASQKDGVIDSSNPNYDDFVNAYTQYHDALRGSGVSCRNDFYQEGEK